MYLTSIHINYCLWGHYFSCWHWSELHCFGFSLCTGHFLIPPSPSTSKRICVAILFLTLPCEPKYLWSDQGVRQGKAICVSPWSHLLTLSSLHDVIGSMLGVLLQSLVQFPAVLADFYLSGWLEEEKVDPDLESDDDDDDWHSFSRVQVRVSHLLSANNTELSACTRSKTPPTYPPPLPYLKI